MIRPPTNAETTPLVRGRDVRDAHVATRRGLRDDVGHQRPVDRQEAPGRRRRPGSPRRRGPAGTGPARTIVMPDGADRARAVDDPLAPEPLSTSARPGSSRRAVHSAATSVVMKIQRLARPGRSSPSAPLEVRDRQDEQERAATEDEEARRDQEQEAALAQDVGAPRLGGDRRPAPAVARSFACGPRRAGRRATASSRTR